MKLKVLGPILVKNTPDCDYKNGEALMDEQAIKALTDTFSKYNIIDYMHEFTNTESNYYMKSIGRPLRIFQSNKEITFTDVTESEITVPAGSAWLESEITDNNVCNEILDKKIVAYSVTVAEEEDAQTIFRAYKNHIGKTANKEDTREIQRIHDEVISKHQRQNISDMINPHMFTVSTVMFPCVYKAKFCKQIVETSTDNAYKMENDNMSTDKKDNISFIQNMTNEYIKLKNKATKGGKKEMKEVEDLIDEKLDKRFNGFADEIKESIKATFEEQRKIEEEEAKKNKEEKESKKKAGKGGKSKNKEQDNKEITKSAQPPRQNDILSQKGGISMKRHEATVLDELIQLHKTAIKTNDKTAIKTALKEIDYNQVSFENTGINNAYNNETYLALLNQQAREIFKASFSVEDTNKAILNTNVFASYVARLQLRDPILDFVTYQTGYYGIGHIYEMDGSNITTQDGHLPAHFYFDNNVEDSTIGLNDKQIQTYTQRQAITISDRQRLANVYGDDLVTRALELGDNKLFRGVAAARIYSDTTLGAGVDAQFKRQDGYIKQAGTQLTGSDVDVDDIVGLFDALFYALPEEAQNPQDYCYFVPSKVRRAFYNSFIRDAGDRRIDLVTAQNVPLAWNDIPIVSSPTLSDPSLRTELADGDAHVLLMSKPNSHLVVGREAGIEEDRHADTSSNTWYETIDTGVAYTFDEYTAVATIPSADFESMSVATINSP